MDTKTIGLTQANDKNFDAEALGFDIRNMSNVKVYQVTKVLELINDGNLHYVKLEFIQGEIADPKADPMIVGAISRTVEQQSSDDVAVSPTQTDYQWRVLWNNKLWRPLDDDGLTLLETFCGIKASDMQKFAEKLYNAKLQSNAMERLITELGTEVIWPNPNHEAWKRSK